MRTPATWGVAIVIGLLALAGLITLLGSHDRSGVGARDASAAAAGPGQPYRGEPVLSPVLEDAVRLGNVAVLYRDAQPPAGTQQLVPPGGKALERAGQSVVLDREPTLAAPLAAVSQRKIELADTPQQLRQFIDYWLGGR